MSSNIKNIGIIGKGIVGTATGEGFKSFGYNVLYHDKYKETNSLEDVIKKSDVVFICVPTPCNENGQINLSAVDSVMKSISKYTNEKTKIIIKSTVLPTTTELYQKKYPHLILFMCPEFLDEITAKYDFLHPHQSIIGFTEKSKDFCGTLVSLFERFDAPIFIIKATEAEMLKYVTNSYFVLKNVFANQVYDLCSALGIDYYSVKQCFVSNPRVADSHFIIEHKGGRGAGGRCLPKDLSAFLHFAQQINSPLEILETGEKINKRLLKESGKC